MIPEALTVGEFNRAMDRLHTTVTGRFESVDTRLDNCVTNIAEVKTLVNERTSREKKENRNTSASWSAAVAGGLVLAVEVLKAWVK